MVESDKIIEEFDVSDWEVETDSGFESFNKFYITKPFEKWKVITESGKFIECADDHIVYDENFNQIFVKNLQQNEHYIITKDGPEKIVHVENTNIKENMFDISVQSKNHRFYGNEVLSHNSTVTSAFILHYILFNSDVTVAMLANKAEIAREILSRVQLAFEHLPKWIQQGVEEWNKGSFQLENNSKVIASATSASAIRGYSINLLFIDEAAFIENWEEFFTSVAPTVTSGKTTKMVLVSTPYGMNHFYKLFTDAQEGRNNYNPIKVTWKQVPSRDEQWKQDTLATLGNDTEKFAQENEVEFLGTSGTLIAGWKLKELVHKTPIVEKEKLYQYETPESGRIYAMTVDVSRGKGLDYSAFQIIDCSKMPYRQVAVFRSNMITPGDFAEVVFRAAKLYNEAFVLVEVNDIGEQVSTLLHWDFEYENLLFTESAGRSGKRISTGYGGTRTQDIGIRTTKTVKNIGCSMLKLLVEQNQLIIHDWHTINELSTFSLHGQSYEAEAGCHDDLAMCLVLFGWISEQKYFKDATDISTLHILRDKTPEQLMEELTPFGFIDDGISNYDDEILDPTGIEDKSFFY